MSGTIYADIRCLQDPADQLRGLQQHVVTLLRTRQKNKLAHWKIIGLLDAKLASLPPEYAALLDQTSHSANPCITGEPAVYLDSSPMTHDLAFGLRFQNGHFLRAAVIYNFVAIDHIVDLPRVADRIDYLAKMARLKRADLLFPASKDAASRLCELLGLPRRRIHITGTAVTLPEELDNSLNDSELRAPLVSAQAQSDRIFHEETVGEKFWSALAVGIERRRSPAVITTGNKPTFAFISPFPPDQTGAAFYTSMTIRAGKDLFEPNLYTDAPRPLATEVRAGDAGAIGVAPIIARRNDAIISVFGDDPVHAPILDFFEQYGGPCILHDARLAHLYFHRLGPERFLEFAGTLLGRPVLMEEVTFWLEDRDVPSLFLDRIIERASPLIVPSVPQQALLKQQFGVNAEVIPGCSVHSFEAGELTDSAKRAARVRRSLAPDSFVISSFGRVRRAKGMEVSVLTLEILRSWHIPAELYFVGDAEHQESELKRLTDLFGIKQHVHWFSGFVDIAVYRDFLVASDAGIQLQTYTVGQFSGGLSDCISAGLRSVANAGLAKSCDAPAYISTVPDRFSPLQVAEQLALLWETAIDGAAFADTRASYLETHNFRYYGRRLLEILGFG